MDYDIAQARKTVQAERKAGTLINASGQAPTRSVIFLDNGTVVASPLRVKRILSLIEKSDSKTGSVQEKRFRVYDVYNDKESEPDDSEKETDVEPEELAEDEAYEDYENFEYDD